MKKQNSYVSYFIITKRRMMGARLTDAMKFRGVTRTEVREILKSEYGYDVSRQTFAKYQKGEIWIPDDFGHDVEEILGMTYSALVDPDYSNEAYERWKKDQKFRADFVKFLDAKAKELKKKRGE